METKTVTDDARFSQTHWSVVLRAVRGTDEEKQAALERLCRKYRTPLYVFLRGAGRSREEAEDVVQEFFLRLLDGKLLAGASPAQGRFRTLLLKALRNLDLDLRRAGWAEKRGGKLTAVPLDAALAEEEWQACPGLTPDAAYDRAWASALVQRAGERLQEEYAAEGKAEQFAELFPRASSARSDETMAEVAARMGCTEGAAKMALGRLRRRFAELMREEVAATVDTEAEGQDELRYLLTCFA